MNAAKLFSLLLGLYVAINCQMLIGHEEVRWQNLMTVEDSFDDLAVQKDFGISGR